MSTQINLDFEILKKEIGKIIGDIGVVDYRIQDQIESLELGVERVVLLAVSTMLNYAKDSLQWAKMDIEDLENYISINRDRAIKALASAIVYLKHSWHSASIASGALYNFGYMEKIAKTISKIEDRILKIQETLEKIENQIIR